MLRWLMVSMCCCFPVLVFAECDSERVILQILGSGGPELDDQRASTSYLLWLDNQAKVLVDVGPGSSLHFGQVGADISDVNAVLLTHLHVDHSADLPAYIKGSYFSQRQQALPVYGPAGNALMPSTTAWLDGLFGSQGVYRYLSDYTDKQSQAAYHLNAIDVPLSPLDIHDYYLDDGIDIAAIPVHHGPVAAIAWRVNLAGCSVTFSGDMNNEYDSFAALAKQSDMLVMHNAVPETATGAAVHLHMTPSQIGTLAQKAQAGQVIIAHRMRRTNLSEAETLAAIRQHYQGRVLFANDLDSFVVGQ